MKRRKRLHAKLVASGEVEAVSLTEDATAAVALKDARGAAGTFVLSLDSSLC
jgi:hypothetical protein